MGTPKIKFKQHIRKELRLEVRRLIDEYGISDAGGLLLLQTFASAYSTELDAQDIINRDGLTILDRFDQKKAHPLLTVIRDSRAQKLAALKALNLDLEPLNNRPGRPEGR
jgi:P27 family predicted phage terminase small subunit